MGTGTDWGALAKLAIADFTKEYTCQWGKLIPEIKQIIFNNPATIIMWKDNTKTVVKAVNEPFDEEKGFAMAYLKKVFGHRNTYMKIIKKASRPRIEEK
jgi:hypothetical protein